MGLKRTTKTEEVCIVSHICQKYRLSQAKKSVLVAEEKLLPCSKVGIALFLLAGNVLYSSWTAILAFSR